MTRRFPAAAPPGDIASLYRSLSPRLKRIVRHELRTSDEVVEDACQFAWSQLIHRAESMSPDRALSWLVLTARREGFKLSHRERREDEVIGSAERPWGEAAGGPWSPDPEEVAEQRWRLREIQRLPARQQRVLWLQALGLSYAEIALTSGCSVRTVERQLLRAKRRLRELQAD